MHLFTESHKNRKLLKTAGIQLVACDEQSYTIEGEYTDTRRSLKDLHLLGILRLGAHPLVVVLHDGLVSRRAGLTGALRQAFDDGVRVGRHEIRD